MIKNGLRPPEDCFGAADFAAAEIGFFSISVKTLGFKIKV